MAESVPNGDRTNGHNKKCTRKHDQIKPLRLHPTIAAERSSLDCEATACFCIRVAFR